LLQYIYSTIEVNVLGGMHMIINDLPASIEWRVYEGDDSSFTIFINDDEGNPEDLTDWTFTSLCRDDLATLVLTPLSGTLTIELTSVESQKLDKFTPFEVNAIKPDDVMWTVVTGNIIVSKNLVVVV
jgi:hypothetical protein